MPAASEAKQATELGHGFLQRASQYNVRAWSISYGFRPSSQLVEKVIVLHVDASTKRDSVRNERLQALLVGHQRFEA